MVRIALIRHFPTDWNAERRLQGRTDRPLTDAARARLAGLALPPAWAEAEIVSSPLSRAAETAAALAGGCRIRLDPRLVEQSWGTWEGLTVDEVPPDPHTGVPAVHRLGWQGAAPGGESAAQAWARVRPALARLARGGDAVVVTHKALMRIVLGQAHGWRGPDGGSVEIKRARLYPLTLAPDGTPHSPGPPDRLIPRPQKRATQERATQGRATHGRATEKRDVDADREPPKAPDTTAPKARPITAPEARPNTAPEARPNTPPEARPNTAPKARLKTAPEARPDTPPEVGKGPAPEPQVRVGGAALAETEPGDGGSQAAEDGAR
ncbi:MAG: histidine phosphatase family protein [Pseudomonadota bacterium]